MTACCVFLVPSPSSAQFDRGGKPIKEEKKPVSSGMEGGYAGEVRQFGGIEMVWCPAGSFTMGSPDSEEGRLGIEGQHQVTLTRGFWMAKTETTQSQWQGVMGSNPSEYNDTLEKPVDSVSWDDVQGWLRKMNEKHPLPEGWKWGLPTEAQWEYACRAGTKTVFAFGDGLKLDQANFVDSLAFSSLPVGRFPANAWGLYDMHGNVYEWCLDYYEKYPSSPVTDPISANYYSIPHIIRGGSMVCEAELCRSAARNGEVPPDGRSNEIGFRAVAIPPTQ